MIQKVGHTSVSNVEFLSEVDRRAVMERLNVWEAVPMGEYLALYILTWVVKKKNFFSCN